MELIYTEQRDGFEPGRIYRNPRHFEKAEPEVEKVVLVGDWPKVAQAYEEDGVEVVVVDAPKRVALISGADTAVTDSLIAELAAIGVIVDSFTEQRLARPEGELGKTAGRLFEVFEAVNAGVTSLQRERDSEAERAKLLQKQVEDLLAQAAQAQEAADGGAEAKEIEDLKAKLDAAKITYRANASKESLEKLVADLAKPQQDS
ncbi:hypothetical protein NJC38_02755 [Pseudomonas sp. 21LCFQ010]|uniref:hypothetical protein n=1 Tax=Pseudomonas sp. 21LCFQ010 TaxID=2957506 RepID=UPI0020985459|nr:hypothetical protein [Pseudomonas sp. 21LCFQ010]MCO8161071.1 hypothetical protein [Pseudomonas sp. 21LCFQ010]